MTYYDPYLDYGGAARIWLAVGLLAIAAGLVYAGIRLPLPAGFSRPGKKLAIVTLATWTAAVVGLLAGVVIYIRQYLQEYPGVVATPYPDHVAPVTFTAVVVVFVIVVARSPHKGGMRLASAAIGAIAAPFIFELPFDLIIMPRVRTPFPVGSVLEEVLICALLVLTDITTLLLLRLSPRVRLTRATFYCLALMFAVFAIWALAGFGYPSSSVPLSLNIVSKLLAFVTALTLFFPQQPARRHPPQLPSPAGRATALTATAQEQASAGKT